MKKYILLITVLLQSFCAFAANNSETKLELFCHIRTTAGMVFLEVYSSGQQKTVELSLMGESLMAPQALAKTPDHGRFKAYISDSVSMIVDKASAEEAPMGNTQFSAILSVDTPDLNLKHEQVSCEMKP